MDMTLPAILIATTVLIVYGVVRLRARRQRRAAVAALGEDVIRHTDEVGVAIQLFRTRAIRGMAPGKTHRTVGAIAITSDQLLLSSDRGVLIDIAPDRGRGRPLSAVRCTGPGRLVLEGSISDTGPGLFRFELTLDHAAAWADALRLFLAEDGEHSVHPAARLPLP